MEIPAAVIAAIDNELTGEAFDAAQAVRDALTAQAWCCDYFRCD